MRQRLQPRSPHKNKPRQELQLASQRSHWGADFTRTPGYRLRRRRVATADQLISAS